VAARGKTAGQRLNRRAHDVKAALETALGRRLRHVAQSRAITHAEVLREAGRTVWENPLEEAYYGPGEGRTAVAHPAARLYQLRDVWVTGAEGFVFTGKREVLRLCRSLDEREERKIRRPIALLARRVEEPVLILTGRGPGNRGHFLCEHLPRFLLARERLPEAGWKVLVTPGHGAWMREYFELLGFAPERVEEGSPGSVFCPEAWLVPNLSGSARAELARPELYAAVRERFLAETADGPGARGRRLFLTRRDAPNRRLANEDAVFAACREVLPGLERVALAGLGLREQVGLFRGAEVVVGPHSQAFRNVLYSTGALCVQLLQGARGPQNEYDIWANNYNCLATLGGNAAATLYNGRSFRGGEDWCFPVKELRAGLERLVELAGEVRR